MPTRATTFAAMSKARDMRAILKAARPEPLMPIKAHR